MIKKNFMTMSDVIFLLIVGAFGAKHFLCRNHLKFTYQYVEEVKMKH